ncbi:MULTISPECIES: DegT/DnrJ/EryC1/StrS family aminotransferase [unclassified Archaeoglobus]|jgi:dTDP-4-amino-4,6-dideoxygalactose transaminase|uniref:DegT/DnrJ/EryC1/StrS family aminotransferase n=1 Tax=unclassified Archaeoglobus TaxID=2643606 RepID=UPI0025C427DC|nr:MULTISPECIES: DegT/DnrJ/EryC1/StrS family aminotransferase [unclassified Archaeoglobus]
MGENIKVAKPFVDEEEVEAVKEVLLSGHYVSGPKVKEFEEKFAEYIGIKHAVAVNSGTAALHVALASLGIGPGDEVIVPPLTFFSTVSAVLHQNAIPVFADVDLESFCLDPADFERKITENTKAVIPVHIFGNAAEMDEIVKIAKENDVKVIEDCAQAHGTEYKGRKVGSIGNTGCFSFYATKHMTTGEGGMITTDSDEIAEKAKIIRNHGMVGRDQHVMLGYNYRMSEINAAIGLVQLRKLEKLNEKRIENSLYLLDRIKEEVEWLRVPEIRDYVRHTFFWCPVIVLEKEIGMTTPKVVEKLKDHGVEVRYRYREPLYKQKVLLDLSSYPKGCPFSCARRQIDYHNVFLPNVEKIAGKIIGLPNHPGLTKEELDQVVETLEKIGRGV